MHGLKAMGTRVLVGPYVEKYCIAWLTWPKSSNPSVDFIPTVSVLADCLGCSRVSTLEAFANIGLYFDSILLCTECLSLTLQLFSATCEVRDET